MTKHFNIRITGGRVRGVFFRVSTKRKAEDLKVRGFVRNEADGSVYVEAEGEEENLKKLVEWCRRGPRLARVMEVAVEPAAMWHFRDFSVR